MIHEERGTRLAGFVDWVGVNIRGDEKGEAQVYLDRLFQGFGHAGVREAGATLEDRIKKTGGKGTSFADLVLKPVVLIEMKKRGQDLTRHYRQAFDYWTRLVPGRPRYVILCNFDEFWVYDFDTQMDAPVDRVKLADLPTRWGPLAFLFPTPEKPIFGNDQVAVTRKAADQLADCFNKLVAKHRLGGTVETTEAQRFLLQMLVALFSEDIGMLPRYMVAQLLDGCKTKQDSRDLIGGLFEAMNTREKTPDDRYRGVEYFNGGLFAQPARVELRIDELDLLKAAAKEDWSKVRPEIFGALFEHSLGKEQRHAFGAHFTHPTDIMKIVGPTIVEPWRKLIDEADTLKRLRELWQRMQDYTVLDPACGSGNFLYIAYRELKRLEARLFERMAEVSGTVAASQRVFGFVSARQFFGLDINPFAVELAKVTMMIARKLAIDELHITEQALPLDNLDANFKAADALIDERGNPSKWPKTDVIIGNPPFLGAKRLKPERGADYIDAVRGAYPEVPGMADYCVYWFRKSHDQLRPCTVDDPVAGRAGLVGTQNVRNNQSRVGGLDHIVVTGTIIEAVDNQPWSGEANVHVSIVNWVKSQDSALLPVRRRLWTVIAPRPSAKRYRLAAADKTVDYDMNVIDCGILNSSLSSETDVRAASTLRCNSSPPRAFRGLEPGNMGFVIGMETAKSLIGKDLSSVNVIKPYITGDELLGGEPPSRWLIDFQRRSIVSAMEFRGAFDHIKSHVLPQMERISEVPLGSSAPSLDDFSARIKDKHLVSRLETWWQLRRCVPETVRSIEAIPRYIGCSRVMKRNIFVFISNAVRPAETVTVFTLPDDYSHGILQASAHWTWLVTKCGKLKSDYRYGVESIFETFPWPQSPTVSQVDAVAEAVREVRRVRDDALTKIKGGLRAVYRTLELPGKNPLKDAHAALDAAVLAAYGFSPKADLLAQLLTLNLDVSRREQAGEPVTAPGIPPGYPDPTRLVTDDCIRAE